MGGEEWVGVGGGGGVDVKVTIGIGVCGLGLEVVALINGSALRRELMSAHHGFGLIMRW